MVVVYLLGSIVGLFLLNEVATYLSVSILGGTYFFFPNSLKQETWIIHHGGAYLLILSILFVFCILYGILLIRSKVGKVLISIPITVVLALEFGNILYSLFDHMPLSLHPLKYVYEIFYYGYHFDLFGYYVGGLILFGFLSFGGVRVMYTSNSIVHGNARWANVFELMAWGMFTKKPESVVLAKYYGKPIYSSGFEHILILAPSGTGKSTAFAIPNILQFTGSTINNDMSSELYRKTATYLRDVKKRKVFMFAPTTKKTHRWNIFTTVLKLPAEERYGQLQRISEYIVSSGKYDSSEVWNKFARRVIEGVSAHLIHETGDCTLGDIADIVCRPDFDSWLHTELKRKEELDPQFVSDAGAYLGITADETRAGIKFNMNASLKLYLDPIVRAATSTSDFTMEDLRNHPTDIFIGIPDKELLRLAPLVTMFWEDACGQLTTKEPTPDQLSILFNMDELGNLNRLNTLRRNITIFRKYRIRAALYFQYKDQSGESYSDKEMQAFFTTKTKLVFTQENQADAEFVSKLFGKRTVKYNTKNQQAEKWLASSNEHLVEKPLITADQLKMVKLEDALISISGKHGIRAKKAYYFNDKHFKKIIKYEINLDSDNKIPVQIPIFPNPANTQETISIDVDNSAKVEDGVF